MSKLSRGVPAALRPTLTVLRDDADLYRFHMWSLLNTYIRTVQFDFRDVDPRRPQLGPVGPLLRAWNSYVDLDELLLRVEQKLYRLRGRERDDPPGLRRAVDDYLHGIHMVPADTPSRPLDVNITRYLRTEMRTAIRVYTADNLEKRMVQVLHQATCAAHPDVVGHPGQRAPNAAAVKGLATAMVRWQLLKSETQVEDPEVDETLVPQQRLVFRQVADTFFRLLPELEQPPPPRRAIVTHWANARRRPMLYLRLQYYCSERLFELSPNDGFSVLPSPDGYAAGAVRLDSAGLCGLVAHEYCAWNRANGRPVREENAQNPLAEVHLQRMAVQRRSFFDWTFQLHDTTFTDAAGHQVFRRGGFPTRRHRNVTQDQIHSVMTDGYQLLWCVRLPRDGAGQDDGDDDDLGNDDMDEPGLDHGAAGGAAADAPPEPTIIGADDPMPTGFYHEGEVHITRPIADFFIWGDDTGRGVAHQLVGAWGQLPDFNDDIPVIPTRKIRGMHCMYRKQVRHDRRYSSIALGSGDLRKEKLIRKFQYLLNREKEDPANGTVREAEENLAEHGRPSKVTLAADYMEHMRQRLEAYPVLHPFYSAEHLLRQRYTKHIMEQRFVGRLAHELKNGNDDQPTILFIGNPSFNPNSRGHPPAMGLSLARKLSAFLLVVVVDEYMTTQICSNIWNGDHGPYDEMVTVSPEEYLISENDIHADSVHALEVELNRIPRHHLHHGNHVPQHEHLDHPDPNQPLIVPVGDLEADDPERIATMALLCAHLPYRTYRTRDAQHGLHEHIKFRVMHQCPGAHRTAVYKIRRCHYCSLVFNRDINAAINIR